MRPHALFAFAAFAAVFAPLSAQAQAPKPAVEVSVPAGEYALDNAHSSVIWRVPYFGLANYAGRFNLISGALTLDPVAPEKSAVKIEIDANSVDTGHKAIKADSTFDAKVAKDAFGADKNPKIAFVSTKVERTGDRTAKVTGNLTLNGQTKPVTLDVTYRNAQFISFTRKNAIGFSATGVLKRSEWGVTAWAGPVADEVTLLIEANFGRDAQGPAQPGRP